MHLVYKALEKRAIPSSLPKELQKPPKSDDFGNGGFVANFPTDIVPVAPVVPPPARPAPPTCNFFFLQNSIDHMLNVCFSF
jgi:hypothetical protein